MNVLGKSLVFYFKYWNEMHRLCGTTDVLEGLSEPEKAREMALQVGDKASRQAADFLESCAATLEERFSSIGRCERVTSRRIVEKNWTLRYSIWPANRRKPSSPKMIRSTCLKTSRRSKPSMAENM